MQRGVRAKALEAFSFMISVTTEASEKVGWENVSSVA